MDSSLELIRQKLKDAPPELRLTIIQSCIRQIADPEQRKTTELMLLLMDALPTTPPKKHIVVLIHGIRTHAVWQERLAQQLASEANIEAFPIGYGFFDVIKFWLPFWTRQSPINRVLRELRTLRTKYHDADISVVAHSFGSYIIANILNEETDIQLHRLQLCGSIISENYRWDKVFSRISGNVINDAGTRDYWPVMASLTSWGYGASGTFGFKTTLVKDRFHDCGHSDFLSDEHMRKYWVPLLIDGQVVPSDWTRSRPSPGIGISFLNWLPLKSLLGIVITVLLIRLII